MSDLSFLEPWRLLVLLAVAALVAGYVVQQRRRTAYAVRFTDLDLLASVAPRTPGWRRHVPAALLVLSLTAMSAAFAKPVAAVEVDREQATVVVALDVSASMQATDVDPNRFAAAKAAATSFVEGLPESFDVALVSFAQSASVRVAPTRDHESVVEAIDRLQLQGGTAIGDAVDASLDAITANAVGSGAGAEAAPARIVLLSDGANTAGRPVQEAAQEAVDAGVPVTTIAYGTPDGTVQVQGRTIAVPVDGPSLQQLAQATEGQYYTAQSGEELAGVYADIGEQVGTTTERREVTAAFTGFALLTALAAGVASLVWFARLP